LSLAKGTILIFASVWSIKEKITKRISSENLERKNF
jgi:hypothetical protein